MRRLFLHMVVSLGGFIEGPNRELDWHFVDDEFEERATLSGLPRWRRRAGLAPTGWNIARKECSACLSNSISIRWRPSATRC